MAAQANSADVGRQISIEHRLPLIIGTLLVAVTIAVASAAYVEVRSSATRIAAERLTNVTRQFGQLFVQSTGQARATFAPVAKSAEITEFARSRNPRLRERALVALTRGATQPEQILATEIRSATGAVVLTTAPPAAGVDTMSVADVIGPKVRRDSATIGRFRLRRDTLVYPIAAPIEGTDSYLVRWRRIVGTRRSREQLSGLVGSDATIFIGNSDGSHWTNLEGVVEGPPLNLSGGPSVQQYVRGPERERYLATMSPIAGTPWVVALDFPLRPVLAPVSSFVQRIALIALVALGLALVAASWMSRQITRPIRVLTAAADAITAGDYSSRADVRGSDEVGRLAYAFNTMASEMQQSRATLEHRVEERTKDLEGTLKQLHDAQESLVRREKLAMLGQLSSGVGHELRNPLGVMTNAVYYLKAVLTAQPKTVHEYLDILQQQITLSEKIVGDLLDFARSKPPQRKPTLVHETTQSQLARLAMRDSIKIDNQLGEDLPPVLVDPTQLGQIILNLITNASQALERGGTISIRAHANTNGSVIPRSEATRDLHFLEYEVSDTGPGVAPENREKIFEPLFTTKARGIGLGLAVSRQLARANGGDLTLESKPGEGATFRLKLPLAGSQIMTPTGAHV